MSVHIFGIRHHGPGCARALRQALEELRPDAVLVEGPPDAQAALPLLTHAEMEPPVALLLYLPDAPSRAVFYPFTHFSPEWQALRYALTRGIPARFMDLPQAIQLAREPEAPEDEAAPDAPAELPAAADGSRPHGNGASRRKSAKSATVPAAGADLLASHAGRTPRTTAARAAVSAVATPTRVREDPLAMLAEAAGYSDHELWWEQQIEQRRDASGLFEGILEAMTALRDDLTPRDDEEAQREAHMRQTIRAAAKEGFGRIAVVCGAWHAPALDGTVPGVGAHGRAPAPRDEKADAALLKGLKRVKVEATWIPWTNSRLSYRSGYGAGVTSPGWYTHLWNAEDRGTIRWVTQAAHLLRAEGLDVSSASVIEAVRLAEALAAMRALPMPGMAELHEAIQTVLCNGDESPMRLIRDKLEIGDMMGVVPAETPAVPLQRDLEMKQRRLRLPPTPEIKPYDLDLRNDTDRARSQLLHQLRLLGIEWGTPQRVYGNKQGSFHELWQLKWEPELAVKLIEGNVWGNTVESAASAKTRHAADAADAADALPVVTDLLDRAILAGLPDAVEHLLGRVQTLAAVSADVRLLMDALPPLARVARYGDVRGTKAERVLPVYDGLFERALVGLPGACASLDDDAAASMVASIDRVQESVALLNRDDQRDEWLQTLRRLTERETIHGLVRGRSCRLLLEAHTLDDAELQRLAGLALSPVVPADQAAAWIDGVLRGSGLILLHQDGLWRALDAWLAELTPDAFTALLPLLRRAFSGFHGPERRAMGEKVKRLRTLGAGPMQPGATAAGADLTNINRERARLVLPVLAQILGSDSPLTS